jgi:hypothetical protein
MVIWDMEITDVLEYYDKPLLCVTINKEGDKFLSVLADETLAGEIWVHVKVSEKRLAEIKSGAIDLHDAFTKAEDKIAHKVSIKGHKRDHVEIPAIELSDDDLPLKGEKLKDDN